MLNPRFEELWKILVERFTRYQTFDRDPARVVELATARAELDDVRAEIATERLLIETTRPRALNRQDARARRETATGVPVMLFDADIEEVTKAIVQLAKPSN